MLWAVLLLVIILALLGIFTVKLLLVLAAIVAVLWLIGFFARGPEARWYRW